MVEYYRVNKKGTHQNGIVVKIKNGKIEVLAGYMDDFREYGCSLDEKGNFRVGKKYSMIQISPEQAKDREQMYKRWINERVEAGRFEPISLERDFRG